MSALVWGAVGGILYERYGGWVVVWTAALIVLLAASVSAYAVVRYRVRNGEWDIRAAWE